MTDLPNLSYTSNSGFPTLSYTKGLKKVPHSGWSLRVHYRERPYQAGSHVAHLNFKTSRVGVYKMLVTYCRLCRLCCNLAEGGCLLSRFHFTCCLGPCRLSEFTLAGPLGCVEPDRYSALKSQLTKAALSNIECDNNQRRKK